MSVRALYRAKNGVLYVVNDSRVFSLDSTLTATLIGTLLTTAGPVSIADNGLTALIVDGSAYGYTITLVGNVFAYISDPAFYGADRVEVIDGFFALNRPGTSQFYLSRNSDVTFDPLYIASKSGLDRLVSLAVVRRELWLFGENKTEVYTDSGSSDFPFQIVGGGMDHGCAACHSVRSVDGNVLWLSRDRDGQAVVMQGSNYAAHRISTHAIEAIFQGYSRLDDAVAYTYQIRGHTIYALGFPTDGHTWCYDLSTGLWHEWQTAGGRHRGQCHAAAYGMNVVGDFQSGAVFALEAGTYTDDTGPIQRVRSFPHMVHNAQRVLYTSFIADMETGTVPAGQPEPFLTLRYSDDRGATYSGTQTQTLGVNGATRTSVQFNRLGMARDRVFEVSWNAPVETALTGAFVQTKVAAS